MKRFSSARQAQRFLSVHEQVANLFHLCSEHVSACDYRAVRAYAFKAWADISGIVSAA